jgi:CRISPR-associated protein Cst2
VFRADVLEEALRVHKDDMLSDLYVGWARGFLDEERKKLEAFIGANTSGVKVHLGHPREVAEQLAAAMKDDAHASWFE